MHSQTQPTEVVSELIEVDLTEKTIPETNDDWEKEFIVTSTLTITQESIDALLGKLFPSTSSASTTSTTTTPDTIIAPLVKKLITQLINIEIQSHLKLEEKQQQALNLFKNKEESITELNFDSLNSLNNILIQLSRHPLDPEAKATDAVYYALRYMRAINIKKQTKFEDIPTNYSDDAKPFDNIMVIVNYALLNKAHDQRLTFLNTLNLDPKVQQHINSLIEIGYGKLVFLKYSQWQTRQAPVWTCHAKEICGKATKLDNNLFIQFKETLDLLLGMKAENPSASPTEKALRKSFQNLLNYTTNNKYPGFGRPTVSKHIYTIYEVIKGDYHNIILQENVKKFLTTQGINDNRSHKIINNLLLMGDAGEENFYLGIINNKKRQQLSSKYLMNNINYCNDIPAESLKKTIQILKDLVRGKNDAMDSDTSELFNKFSKLLSYFENENNSEFIKIIGCLEQALEMQQKKSASSPSTSMTSSSRPTVTHLLPATVTTETEDDHNDDQDGKEFAALSSSSSSTSTTPSIYQAHNEIQSNSTIEEIFQQLEACKASHRSSKEQQKEEAKKYIGEKGHLFKKIIEDGKLTVAELSILRNRIIAQVQKDQNLDYLCMAYTKIYPKGYYSPLFPNLFGNLVSDSRTITTMMSVIEKRIIFLSSSQKLFDGSSNVKTTEKRNSPEKRS